MPQATLTFDLDEPDDARAHHLAIHAGGWHTLAWDMDQELRRFMKYGHAFASADAAPEHVRDWLWREAGERGLSLDG